VRGTKRVASVQSHRGPFLYDIISGGAIAPVSRFGARVRLPDDHSNCKDATSDVFSSLNWIGDQSLDSRKSQQPLVGSGATVEFALCVDIRSRHEVGHEEAACNDGTHGLKAESLRSR
jgi:hypothetical protein